MSPDAIQDELEARGLLDMVGDVALSHHVTLDEVCSKKRTKRIAAARHAAWAKLRTLGFSYPEIAALWDVTHGSVFYAVNGR